MEKIYALIKNNIIQNMIVADDDFIKKIQSDWQYIVETTNEPGGPDIGWHYDGTNFYP